MMTIEWVIAAAIAVIVATLLTLGFVSASASKQCLAAGWPAAKVDYSLNQYCVKRVDQTDVVVPLEQIK